AEKAREEKKGKKKTETTFEDDEDKAELLFFDDDDEVIDVSSCSGSIIDDSGIPCKEELNARKRRRTA
ncbi:MAG: hypothetical protein AAGJ35_16080, partial [Myxococcota bacterium]